MNEIIMQTGVPLKPVVTKRQDTENDSEEDDGDLQGKTTTAAGVEVT